MKPKPTGRWAAATLLAIVGMAGACRGKSGDITPPGQPNVSVAPETFVMDAGQSVDLHVALSGFPAGTAYSCTVVPTQGAVTIIGTVCRVAAGPTKPVGGRVIVQAGAYADTAIWAVNAR